MTRKYRKRGPGRPTKEATELEVKYAALLLAWEAVAATSKLMRDRTAPFYYGIFVPYAAFHAMERAVRGDDTEE